jgi:hypothetical protein
MTDGLSVTCAHIEKQLRVRFDGLSDGVKRTIHPDLKRFLEYISSLECTDKLSVSAW